jgi:hypothetical protein
MSTWEANRTAITRISPELGGLLVSISTLVGGINDVIATLARKEQQSDFDHDDYEMWVLPIEADMNKALPMLQWAIEGIDALLQGKPFPEDWWDKRQAAARKILEDFQGGQGEKIAETDMP